MKKKEIIPIAAVLLAGLLIYIGISSLMGESIFGKNNIKPHKTGKEGQLIPSFHILLPDSTLHNVSNSHIGKPVVIFYFGPQCPYCREEMKIIIEKMDLLKNIQFYAITPYAYGEMKKFYEHFQLKKYENFIVGVDDKKFVLSYFKTYNIPFLAIYGKNNRLKKAFIGKINPEKILEVAEN